MIRSLSALLTSALITTAPVWSQTTNVAGGAAGADMSLDAISPENEAVSVGLAGEDPADIARYLLASGAGGGSISPDGRYIASLPSASMATTRNARSGTRSTVGANSAMPHSLI